MSQKNPMIASHFRPGESESEVNLLSRNLTQYGGRYRNYPHVFFKLPEVEQLSSLTEAVNVNELITLSCSQELLDFPFAAKVIAAAEAEVKAKSLNSSELIWLDPDSLLFNEPIDLHLLKQEKIAISPVHLCNISSLSSDPIDDYWKLVYAHCHVPEERIFMIDTMIDQIKIRAHFNAGLISVNPHLGILNQWKENFLSLYRDPRMGDFYHQDIRYKIFAHQAVLSATILSMCRLEEIKLLPKTYNFPLHLVKRMKPQDQPISMEQLMTVRYDDFDLPGWSTSLPSNEPLRFWLLETIRSISGE